MVLYLYHCTMAYVVYYVAYETGSLFYFYISTYLHLNLFKCTVNANNNANNILLYSTFFKFQMSKL